MGSKEGTEINKSLQCGLNNLIVLWMTMIVKFALVCTPASGAPWNNRKSIFFPWCCTLNNDYVLNLKYQEQHHEVEKEKKLCLISEQEKEKHNNDQNQG